MSDSLHPSPTASQALVRSPLTEQIVEWLSAKIISGEYKPNDPLPEVEIAESLGCSRSPLREAFRILAQQGLVDLNPGKSAVVAPLDADEAAEFYDTRALLEAHVTLLVTKTLSDEDIEELGSVLEELKHAHREADLAKCQRLNDEFHSILYGLCPNQTLVEIVNLIWRRTLRYGRLRRRDVSRVHESIQRKEQLFRFIQNRDAHRAAEMMRTIVLSGKSDVVSALRRKEDSSIR